MRSWELKGLTLYLQYSILQIGCESEQTGSFAEYIIAMNSSFSLTRKCLLVRVENC